MNIKDSDYPISEYLQLMDQKDGKSFQCKWCGETVCGGHMKWKDEVPSMEFPTTKAGPLRARNEEFLLREYYCPSCATLLDTEVTRKGHDPLHDKILH